MSFIYLTILSIFLLYMAFKCSLRFEFYDLPDAIKIHTKKVPNIGGLALIPYVLFMLYFYDYSSEISATMNLFLVVIVIGFIDDIKNIKPQIKLLSLFIPIYIFAKNVSIVNTLGLYNGYEITLGPLGLIFTILCIFLLINAYNYIDGLDGLLAINTIITLLTFFILIISEKNFFFPLLIFLTIYFLFNINFLGIFPKQFLGNSGSLAIGFLISALLIIYTQSEKLLHPSIIIWTVAFVVYEFLAINIIRIKQGKNIFKRDLNFIFNILDKKYSSIKSLVICSTLHLFFCSMSILINFYDAYFLSIILFIVFFLMYIAFRFKQIYSI